jgi:hypothetical protein
MTSNKQRTIALSTVAIAAVIVLFAAGPLVATQQAQAQVPQVCIRTSIGCLPSDLIPSLGQVCVVCAIVAGHQGHQVQASHSTGQIGIPHGK